MKKIYFYLGLLVVLICSLVLIEGLVDGTMKTPQFYPLFFVICFFLFAITGIPIKNIKDIFRMNLGKQKVRIPGGEDPPLHLWKKYPNWEPALDEEGKEDQDELTLKPSDEQHFIQKYVAFTAGDVITADGRKLPALIDVGQCPDEPPDGFNIYADNSFFCGLAFNSKNKKWRIQNKESSISINDLTLFPLTVTTRLPRNPGAKPYHFVVKPGGSSVPSP